MQAQYGAYGGGAFNGCTSLSIDQWVPFGSIPGSEHFALGAFSGSNGLPADGTTFSSEDDYSAYAASLLAKTDQISDQSLNCGLFDVYGSYEIIGGNGGDLVTADGRNPPFFSATASTGDGSFWGRGGDDYLAGGTGNDYMSGGVGNDTLLGGDGNDTLVPGAGIDSVDGGSGVNTLDLSDLTQGIVYQAGVDGTITVDGEAKTIANFTNVIGTAGDDTLSGTDGDNNLNGGAGSDLLIAGKGADTLDGGDGDDTASFAGSAQALSVDLTAGTVTYADSTTQTIANVETIVGSRYADQIWDSAADERLNGGAGDDTLHASGGHDTLVGGPGFDIVDFDRASAGVDIVLGKSHAQAIPGGSVSLTGIEGVIGSSWNDRITGGKEADSINGGFGDDLIIASRGADSIDGGFGDDTLSFARAGVGVTVTLSLPDAQQTGLGEQLFTGVENVTGTKFADAITGDFGSNLIVGGDGNDTLDPGAGGSDTLSGGSGRNTISFAADFISATFSLALSVQDVGGHTVQASGFSDIIGGVGFDHFTGDAHSNLIQGGAGNDTLTISGGIDTLDGGDGSDVVDFSGRTTAVHLDLADQGHVISLGGLQVELVSIEGLIGTSKGDSLTSSDWNFDFSGGGGSDTLSAGGDGSATAFGQFDGGDGDDVLDLSGFGQGVFVGFFDPATDMGQVQLPGGTLEFIQLLSVESVVGTAFDDVFSDQAGGHSFSGGEGNDLVQSAGGSATLDGGAGIDILSYMSATSGVDVDLAVAKAQQTGHGLETIRGFEQLQGTTFADSLSGTTGDDTISGMGGADTIDGHGGGDHLFGNFFGGAPSGMVTYFDAANAVDVSLDQGPNVQHTGVGDQVVWGFASLTGSAFNDTLDGTFGNQAIQGGDGADRITGDAGDDTLSGGKGADTLIGGTGSDLLVSVGDGDRLSGGANGDIFRFTALAAKASATIIDLDAKDTVDLRPAETAAHESFSHVAAFDGHAGEFVLSYDATANATSISFDFNGDAKTDHVITLSGGDYTGFAGIVI